MHFTFVFDGVSLARQIASGLSILCMAGNTMLKLHATMTAQGCGAVAKMIDCICKINGMSIVLLLFIICNLVTKIVTKYWVQVFC